MCLLTERVYNPVEAQHQGCAFLHLNNFEAVVLKSTNLYTVKGRDTLYFHGV